MIDRRRRIPIDRRDPATSDEQVSAAPAEEPRDGTADSETGGNTHPSGGPSGKGGSGGDGAPAADGPRAPQDDAGTTEKEPSPDERAPAEIEAERDSYLDNLLRLKAEFENYRKRSSREMAEVEARARGRLLVEFLPVLDNLGRALDAAEHHEEGKVLEGVRLTHGQFLALLAKEGVTEIDPLGEQFDPHKHDAMLTQPSDQPEGTVVAVLERGYAMGDRILRPARVSVSSGPPAD